MKTILKTLTVTALAVGALASQAYAGSDQQQRRIAEQNAAYFERMGHKASSGPVTQNPDYDFAVNPQQRLAKRSDAYWAKVGYGSAKVELFNPYTDVSEYPFSGSVLSAERGGYVFHMPRSVNEEKIP